jgi:hypothetical protein
MTDMTINDSYIEDRDKIMDLLRDFTRENQSAKNRARRAETIRANMMAIYEEFPEEVKAQFEVTSKKAFDVLFPEVESV